MENIKNQRALITGGGRGIGKAIAIALANEGVHIAITGQKEEVLQATVNELKALGVEATYQVFNVANYDAVKAGMVELNQKFGKFDILVNNAGVAAFGSVMDMDVDTWKNIVEINLFGAYHVTKEVLPQLIEKNQGDIINIASTAGVNGAATTSSYSASKFGLIGFSDSLMREVRKHNIRVSTLMPSTVASDMSKELGLTDGDPATTLQPEDFAEMVVAHLKLPRRALLKSASIWSTNP